MVLTEDGAAIESSDRTDIAHALLDAVVIQVAMATERLNRALADAHGDLTGMGVGVGDEA